jgi:transcriptional coactivator HFI1/ADA1
MATIRPDTINLSTAPSLSNKALPSLLLVSKPEQRRSAPRLDAEPLYNAIKTAISDADWSFYKASISAFLLGNLNQEELTQRLDGILSTPALEHAHNQFILGIFGNLTRDAPELGVVASWADDKVVGKGSSGAGKGGAGGKGGDEEEKRLKTEIMMLPRRERKRLKMVVDHGKGGGDADGRENWMGAMNEYFDARRAKMPDIGPASAGGFQKTSNAPSLEALAVHRLIPISRLGH